MDEYLASVLKDDPRNAIETPICYLQYPSQEPPRQIPILSVGAKDRVTVPAAQADSHWMHWNSIGTWQAHDAGRFDNMQIKKLGPLPILLAACDLGTCSFPSGPRA